MVDETEKKQCVGCGEMFPPSARQRARPGRWAAAKYCSLDCANKSRTAVIAAKPCAGCEEPMERRPKEKPGDFKRRRFCSHKCSSRFANSCRDYSIGKKPPPPPHVVEEPPEPVESKMIWRPESLGGPYLWTPGMLHRPTPSSLLGP